MNKKSFAMGFCSAALLLSTYNVIAANYKVEAFLRDEYRIEVDGKIVNLPGDMHIVNYDNRMYMPARFIAESMDGKVEWNANENVMKITKPVPQVVEKIVEKIVEKEVPAKITYQTLPLKLQKQNLTMSINGISTVNNLTNVYMDVKSETSLPLMVDYSNAYIEYNGQKYNVNPMSGMTWGNSIDANQEKKGASMVFDKLPDGAKEIVLCIPVSYDIFNREANRENFIYNIKMD